MVFTRSLARLTGLSLATLVFVLDQASKAWVAAAFERGALPQDVLPFFDLVLVHNRGISFGLFSQMPGLMPLILTLVTSAIALALLMGLMRTRDGWTSVALGVIIGGALGNIFDRVRLGAVIDFLDFHLGAHHWPAFNVADSAIFIGVVILVLISIVKPAKGSLTAPR